MALWTGSPHRTCYPPPAAGWPGPPGTDPRPSPTCPSWPGCWRGQGATRPPRPQRPLPQSGAENSRPPAQGHLLSGGEPSPLAPPGAPLGSAAPARTPQPPSVRRPLAGSGEDLSPETASGLEPLSPGKGSPRVSRAPDAVMIPGPAGLRALSPAPRFPWQLPPARPPPPPPTGV